MGNRSTIKAAGYVKELCLVALFGLQKLQQTGAPLLVLNFTMNPAPTVQQMVETIQEVTGKSRAVWNLPRSLLLGLSYTTSAVANVFGINTPINPVRVRKLFRSNNIVAEQLRNLNYKYTYSLKDAFADWMEDCPADFSILPVRTPTRVASRSEALNWDRSTMVPEVPKS